MVRFAILMPVTCALALVACGGFPEGEAGSGKLYLDAASTQPAGEGRYEVSVNVLCGEAPCRLPPGATEYCVYASAVRMVPNSAVPPEFETVYVGKSCSTDLPPVGTSLAVKFVTDPLPEHAQDITLVVGYSSDDHMPTAVTIPVE